MSFFYFITLNKQLVSYHSYQAAHSRKETIRIASCFGIIFRFHVLPVTRRIITQYIL